MGTILDRFARRMVDWLWAPPKGMPLLDVSYAEWIKSEGVPLKRKNCKASLMGRGSKEIVAKPIHEFFHRGGYERHEIKARHTPKSVLPFRGKGFKTERRRRARKNK